MMNGGPSHVDTFDYKPQLAKYAGQPLPPDKKFTNSGGRKMGFLTPAWRDVSARRPKRAADLRLLSRGPRARRQTGRDPLVPHRQPRPRLGAGGDEHRQHVHRPAVAGQLGRLRFGHENQNLPGYVVILDKRGGPISGQPNWSSGFMPASYQGTLFRPVGDPMLDLRGPGISIAQRSASSSICWPG